MGGVITEPTSPDTAFVTLESGEVSTLLMDLTVLGGMGRAAGFFAHVTMRSAASKQPLGYVRTTLVGLGVTAALAQSTALEIATRAWSLKRTDSTKPHYLFPSGEATPKLTIAGESEDRKDGESLAAEPVVSEPDRTIWLVGTEDLRPRNQGVRVTLNLRTEDPHAGYLFAQILTASPEAAVDAASSAARGLWLTDPADPSLVDLQPTDMA